MKRSIWSHLSCPTPAQRRSDYSLRARRKPYREHLFYNLFPIGFLNAAGGLCGIERVFYNRYMESNATRVPNAVAPRLLRRDRSNPILCRVTAHAAAAGTAAPSTQAATAGAVARSALACKRAGCRVAKFDECLRVCRLPVAHGSAAADRRS